MREKKSKRLTYQGYDDMYTNFLLSMFDSDSNIFKSNWDLRTFEDLLTGSGKLAIYYLDGELIYSDCDFVGGLDYQGIPKDLIAITANGKQTSFKNWLHNDNVVVMSNNKSRTPDTSVKKYSELSTEAWTSIKAAIIGTRYSDIIGVNDSKQKTSVQNAINANDIGKPIVIEDRQYLGDNNTRISHTSLTQFKDSDKLQYLLNLIQWSDRQFKALYGMSSLPINKSAHLNNLELLNGAYSNWVEVLDRLDCRIKGFADVKNKFGVDVDYHFSRPWQLEFERIFNCDAERGDDVAKTDI